MREQRPQAQQDDGVPLHPRGVRADRQHGRLERHEQAGLHHGEADGDRDNGEAVVADAAGAARLHEGPGRAAPRRVRRRRARPTSITVIHSSRPWLPSGAAHSAVRAMVPPIFPCGTVRARRAAQCPFSSARRLNRLMAIGAHDGSGDGSRWVELVGPPRNGHEPYALAHS